MAFDDRTKASFDMAGETIKQLLAVSIGSIGAAIALFDDGNKPGVDFGADGATIKSGLILLAISVVFGLFSLGSIVGQLGNDAVTKPSTYAWNIRFFYSAQLATLGLGISALVFATL